MRLIIPGIGTEITVIEDWTFRLFHESRNEKLGEVLGLVDVTNVPHQSPVYSMTRIPNPAAGRRDSWGRVEPDFFEGEEQVGTETRYYRKKIWLSRLDSADEAVRRGDWKATRGLFDTVTLPAGTVLKVDRLYIRKIGAATDEYSSVTFIVQSCPLWNKKKPRFWAKLAEVNRMLVEFNEDTLPPDV